MEIKEEGAGQRHPRADHWEFAIADIIDRSNKYLGQEIPPALVGILGARILTHLNHEFEAGYSKCANYAAKAADHAAIEMERARTNWATVKDAAEMEHKMAAAEWAAERTALQDELRATAALYAEDTGRRIDTQLRCKELETALAATGVYLSQLKIYDTDTTAQRIVARNLELLSNGAEGQEPGTGYYNASKFEVDGSPIPNPTNAQRYAQWFAEGEALADAALRSPAEEPGAGEEKSAPLVAGEECQRLGHDFVVGNYQMVCSRCPNPGAPTKDEGVSGGKGEGVSMKRSDLIKAAEAMGGAITWHGPIIEDLEHDWSNSGADCPTCLRCGIMQDHADSTDIGFCSGYLWQWGVPPEGRTTKTEAEPRTVFESHEGKANYPRSPNTGAVNGENYNAAAANLRAIMPTAEPIWQGAKGQEPGAGGFIDLPWCVCGHTTIRHDPPDGCMAPHCHCSEFRDRSEYTLDGDAGREKSVPGAIATGQDAPEVKGGDTMSDRHMRIIFALEALPQIGKQSEEASRQIFEILDREFLGMAIDPPSYWSDGYRAAEQKAQEQLFWYIKNNAQMHLDYAWTVMNFESVVFASGYSLQWALERLAHARLGLALTGQRDIPKPMAPFGRTGCEARVTFLESANVRLSRQLMKIAELCGWTPGSIDDRQKFDIAEVAVEQVTALAAKIPPEGGTTNADPLKG